MHLCLLGPADLSATSAPSSSPPTARAHALSSPRRAVWQPEAAESAGVWSPSNEGLVVAVSSSGWVLDGGRAGDASGWRALEIPVSPALAGTALEALEALTLAVVGSMALAVIWLGDVVLLFFRLLLVLPLLLTRLLLVLLLLVLVYLLAEVLCGLRAPRR